MRAHIARNWPAMGYDVYLWYETTTGRTPMLFKDGLFKRDSRKYDVGEAMPSTLFLSAEIYEALRNAMIGDAIDNDDALKDTRMIRDRLLVMIESGWKSHLIAEQ